jgi:hypothetical protein
MRKLLFLVVIAVTLAAPAAQAGVVIEGSLGKGASVSPHVHQQPLNVMIAPGVSFLASILRLQLGFVADVPDVENSKFDFGLRPMLTLSPPLFPLYGRVIVAFNNLFHEELRTIAYGAALGLGFSVGPVGVFAEAGLLPRSFEDEMQWVLEGRAGVSLGF